MIFILIIHLLHITVSSWRKLKNGFPACYSWSSIHTHTSVNGHFLSIGSWYPAGARNKRLEAKLDYVKNGSMLWPEIASLALIAEWRDTVRDTVRGRGIGNISLAFFHPWDVYHSKSIEHTVPYRTIASSCTMLGRHMNARRSLLFVKRYSSWQVVDCTVILCTDHCN